MSADAWMERYRNAWISNEPADIAALFTADAVYSDYPHEISPARGHDQIVARWIAGRDEPDDFTFEYSVVIESPALAIVQGVTDYTASGGRIFDNLWVIRLEGDVASELTEWYKARQ